MTDQFFDLGKIDDKKVVQKYGNRHVPSIIQPDTLFTFTTELKWLIHILQHKMLSPRYCEENIAYLKIKKMKYIAYPMKCFCDINMHKLDYHMKWYGDYGIAFTKEWGMNKNIQPVHYLNEQGNLRKDITEVFRKILNEDIKKEDKVCKMLKDYFFHELMFYKPYQGKFKNRNTGKESTKCFADECEWRYVPDVTIIDFPQAIPNESLINTGLLTKFNDVMNTNPKVSLCFEYAEIKHIIIQTQQDYKILVDAIAEWNIKDDKYDILSKVLVWENAKGDF